MLYALAVFSVLAYRPSGSNLYRENPMSLFSRHKPKPANDVYVLRIPTSDSNIYWVDGKITFTDDPMKAAQFTDTDSALDQARELNRLMACVTDCRFHVALRDEKK